MAAGCVLAGCDRDGSRRSPTVREQSANAVSVELQHVSSVATHGPRELIENSAAAMSTRQPGVLFTINDSGNAPLLFAIDTTGANRGVWRVLGASNVDWEAASMGPCGTAHEVERCVYIGDVGDNVGSHSSRVIYRVAEPNANGETGTVQAEMLRYTYADQRHDVEAMYVAANGDIYLITKRPMFDRAGHLRPALVFRLPASAWGTRQTSIAQLSDSLPIVPGSAPFRLITDASLAPDARHVAVRTYSEVYVFATNAATGAVNHDVPPTVCDITALGERQGEGVTWVDALGRLVFTSEGRNAPLELADCRAP